MRRRENRIKNLSRDDCTSTDDPLEMEALATSFNKLLFEFEGVAGMEDVIDTVLVKVMKAMDAIPTTLLLATLGSMWGGGYDDDPSYLER